MCNYFDEHIYALTADLNIKLAYINNKNELVFEEVFKQNQDSYKNLDDFKEWCCRLKNTNYYDWYAKIHFWYIDFSGFGEWRK